MCTHVYPGWSTTNIRLFSVAFSSQGKVLYETLVYKEVPGHPDQWLLECCSEVQASLVKHLQKYINEFANRTNVRPMHTIDQINLTLKGLVGKRLTYRDLIT